MSVATYSLCTLKEVKQYYTQTAGKSPHTGYSEDDELIEDLIDSMSVLFESYCDRQFLTRERTEYYDGEGSKFLFLDYTPVTSVSGIWNSTTWSWDDTNLISSDDYMVKSGHTIVLKSTVFTKYDQNIKIIYTAGYTTVPEDIRLACVEEVTRSHKNRKGVDVLAKTAADGSVTRYAKDLMPSTIRVLNTYRRLSVQ
jgi:hypothetical protein